MRGSLQKKKKALNKNCVNLGDKGWELIEPISSAQKGERKEREGKREGPLIREGGGTQTFCLKRKRKRRCKTPEKTEKAGGGLKALPAIQKDASKAGLVVRRGKGRLFHNLGGNDTRSSYFR